MTLNSRFLSVGKKMLEFFLFSSLFLLIFLTLNTKHAYALSCQTTVTTQQISCMDTSAGYLLVQQGICQQIAASNCASTNPYGCNADANGNPLNEIRACYSCGNPSTVNWTCNSGCIPNTYTYQTATSCGSSQNACNYSYDYNSTTCGYVPPSTCYSPSFCVDPNTCISSNGLQVTGGSCNGSNVCCGLGIRCGDRICNNGETNCTCPQDCSGTCPTTCSPPCSSYAGYCDNQCNEYTTYCSSNSCVKGSLIATNTPTCNGVVWNGQVITCPIGPPPTPPPSSSTCAVTWGSLPSPITPNTSYTIPVTLVSSSDSGYDVTAYEDDSGGNRLRGDGTMSFDSGGQGTTHTLTYYNNDFVAYGNPSGTGPKTACTPTQTFTTAAPSTCSVSWDTSGLPANLTPGQSYNIPITVSPGNASNGWQNISVYMDSDTSRTGISGDLSLTATANPNIDNLRFNARTGGAHTLRFYNHDNAGYSGAGPDPTNAVLCTPPQTVTTQSDQVPKGWHDGATCSVINGWTCDPDNYNLPLAVHFYEGPGFTNFVGATTANLYGQDLVDANVCGGTGAHRFNFTPPSSLINGSQHTIYAYPINIDSGGNPAGINPALNGTPKTLGPCAFNASGLVYVDKNKNGSFDAGVDSPYSGSTSITICQGNQPGGCQTPYQTITSGANGVFANSSFPAGPYTASLTVPSGYQATSPKPPVAFFTVGGSCSATAPASCDAGGNVSNLNFGITNSNPWMQVIGGDILANGFTDNIPATADLACSGGAYASAVGTGGTPGVVNTGSSDADFGAGHASVNNWLVGGLGSGNYPYVYNMPLSKKARTSYDNLNYLVHQSNIQTKPLTDLPGCISSSNCQLPTALDNFSSGTYTVDGPLTLTSDTGTYTFPSGGNYVILVNGALNINTKIKVPSGSFVLFSTSGDINVDSTVGNNADITASNLEGYYSTDRNFNVLGKGANGAAVDCSTGTKDLRLNVAGSIIVNADTSNNGGFYYNRDMCADDLRCPVFTITERPDFWLNAPTFMMFPRRLWQEVAP